MRELLSNQGKLAGDKHFDSNNRQQTTVAALLEQRGQDRYLLFRFVYQLVHAWQNLMTDDERHSDERKWADFRICEL